MSLRTQEPIKIAYLEDGLVLIGLWHALSFIFLAYLFNISRNQLFKNK